MTRQPQNNQADEKNNISNVDTDCPQAGDESELSHKQVVTRLAFPDIQNYIEFQGIFSINHYVCDILCELLDMYQNIHYVMTCGLLINYYSIQHIMFDWCCQNR